MFKDWFKKRKFIVYRLISLSDSNTSYFLSSMLFQFSLIINFFDTVCPGLTPEVYPSLVVQRNRTEETHSNLLYRKKFQWQRNKKLFLNAKIGV